MLVQSRDIEKVLAKYKEIRSFKYEIASVEAYLSDDSPLHGLVAKARHDVRFDSSVDSSLIIKGIQNMMSTVKEKTARIEVLDDQDEPVSVKIMDVPVNYGEMAYDDFILGLMTFDPKKLRECSLVKALKDKCETEYAHVFSKKVVE